MVIISALTAITGTKSAGRLQILLCRYCLDLILAKQKSAREYSMSPLTIKPRIRSWEVPLFSVIEFEFSWSAIFVANVVVNV